MKTTWNQIKLIGEDFKDHHFQLLFLITLVMLLVEYFGWQRPFFQYFAPELALKASKHQLTFYAQVYTTISFIAYFIIIPTLFYKTLGASVPMEGLGLPKVKDIKPYLVFGLIMLLVLSIACNSPNFYNFYPLYRPKSFYQWLLFESVYLPQFIAVEFFFRGPILFSLHSKFKRHAIVLMTMPYALIHIHKPFPEAIGSIGAGLILGHYSLKSRSIWFGVLLHMLIAISADFFGLLYSGSFSNW